MSDMVEEAVKALNDRIGGGGLDGTAKFVIDDEGALMIDQAGARRGDEEADVTLSASAETFRAILSGEESPTAAFMTGKLKVDGDMGMAMKLAGVLG